MRESTRIYRDLFDEAPKAVLSVGTDGRIRMANRRAQERLGYQLDGIARRPVLDLYADSPPGKGRAQELFLQFRAGVEIHTEAVEMLRADGIQFWANLSVRPIRDTRGQVVASCSLVDEFPESKGLKESSQSGLNGQSELSGNSKDAYRLVTLLKDFKIEQRYPDRLLITSRGRTSILRVEEIDWIEAGGNYVELHVGQKAHLLRETMNSLEARLDPRKFLRVHRSAIVNVERIKELQARYCGDYEVFLGDGTQLRLSRGYREKLQELIGGPP